MRGKVTKRARTRSQRVWAFLVGNRSISLLNRSLLLVSASADWWDKCDVVRGLEAQDFGGLDVLVVYGQECTERESVVYWYLIQ